MKKGKFIVLEGIDYCGKGTQSAILARYFFNKDKKSPVVLTREPTMLTEEGRTIRNLLMTMKNPLEGAEKLFHLYVEDRKKHVNQFIQPALDFGAIVISDRYKYSTIAYQGAQGNPIEKIIEAHYGLLIPDLAIVLDITPEEYAERATKERGTHVEIFDQNKEFIARVREIYLQMPKLLPDENIKIISAMPTFEEVHQQVISEVEKALQ